MMMSPPQSRGCLPASWRLAGGYLIERRHDGDVRLWGPWDGMFGCWSAYWTPVVPEWQPIGRLGVWHEPAGQRDDDWYNSRAAIAAYWSAVPTWVRLEVSRQTGYQWRALMDRWRTVSGAQVWQGCTPPSLNDNDDDR